MFFCAVPPRWITEPVDINVERNKHAVIDCQAEGVPTPVLLWKKAIGNSPVMTIKLDTRSVFFLYQYSSIISS